ncbi:hypothetical protein [Roseomonas chloroacetimidivorans]|uniref:hypothetical protein n=1 Tax=Roseomonas chloroacetimidivorans TaxID=1766656 RepID=UPI003C75ED07
MKPNPFDDLYYRILDAQLGVAAISEITRNASPYEKSADNDRRLCVLDWIAKRVNEQLEAASAFAEEQGNERRRKT